MSAIAPESNLQVYLSGHSGEPIRADRITRDMPPVHKPGLSVVISTQPVVFEGARRNELLQRRGFLARFLYAVPRSRAGTRHLATRPRIPVAVERTYAENLMRICRIGDARSTSAPAVLRLSDEARAILVAWHDAELEPRRDPLDGDLGATDGVSFWAAKLHGAVARIAGVLHVAIHLDDAERLLIDADTVRRAIVLGTWCIDHAFAAFGVDRLDRVGLDAMRLRRWYRALPDRPASFTIRQATRALKGMSSERIRDAAERLELHGYVRRERSRSGPAGGRPSDIIHIHPDDRGEAVA